eukprot:scaffold942_cov366-Prasinococcus_capsulatus_cf.AAC.11
MPDANKEAVGACSRQSPALSRSSNTPSASQVVNALVGACFGASGQRCMALTAAVCVGDLTEYEEALK